jgi:hypothetical protein
MKALVISGETLQEKEWNVEDILTDKIKSKNRTICDMLENAWDNKVSRCGMTYLEIEQFDNQYNNFR